jgi:hypothetical protein
MYPPLALASVEVSEEEREAMDAAMHRSRLGPLARVWSDTQRSAADRGDALAALDPTFAHVHLLLADLVLRAEDVRAEPFPRLRASIAAARPALAHAYTRLLAELAEATDSESEQALSLRGFDHAANEAVALLETPDERACFVRGRMAWGAPPPSHLHPELVAELAERKLVHTAAGVSAQLSAAELTALECPELLTKLRTWGPAAELTGLARAAHLRELCLASDITELDRVRGLEALQLESLVLESEAPARVTLPRWLPQLASLRALALRFTVHGVDAAAVALPPSIATLSRLETLTLSGIGALPDALGQLVGLRELDIRGWKLVGLPASLGALTGLVKLSVDAVLALPGLPEGFERLTALRDLRLGHLDTPELPRVLLSMLARARAPDRREAMARRAGGRAACSAAAHTRVGRIHGQRTPRLTAINARPARRTRKVGACRDPHWPSGACATRSARASRSRSLWACSRARAERP